MSSSVSGATPFFAPSLACTGAADGGCDVRAVTVAVVPALHPRLGEVLARDDPALQVGVLGVGAGVEDRRRSCRRRRSPPAQASGALTCCGRRSRVASTLRSSQSFSIEPAARLRGFVRSAQNVGGLRLVGAERDTVDRLEHDAGLGAARGHGGSGREVGVLRDERHESVLRVVVALTDEAGDVEELLVDLAGGQRLRPRRPGRRRRRRRRGGSPRSAGEPSSRGSTVTVVPFVTRTRSPVTRVTRDRVDRPAGRATRCFRRSEVCRRLASVRGRWTGLLWWQPARRRWPL